ncbi:MAG: NUDIX domain-containing protein [Anaerolineales bacterium]|nr:NUDIX domain-containing protein [Anaerolineales bacterium]
MSGYVAELRRRAGPGKVLLVYATALIRDAAGRLLFQRRADFGWWGLPGGVLEVGESLAECAAREAREETGLEVQPVRLVGVYSGPQYDVVYPNGDAVQQWTAALECRVTGGASRADGAEALDQAFFGPEALPATSPWYAAMARDLFAGRPAAAFEPPRPAPPDGQGATILQLRARMGREWIVAPGASAVIRDEAGQVLLVRRTDNGHWMPPSGFMDLGESVAETAVREVREETGLDVEPVRLVGAYAGADNRVVYPNGDPVQVVSTVFECRWRGGQLRPDAVEVGEAGFFAWDRLPEPIHPRIRRRLADAALGRAEAFFV